MVGAGFLRDTAPGKKRRFWAQLQFRERRQNRSLAGIFGRWATDDSKGRQCTMADRDSPARIFFRRKRFSVQSFTCRQQLDGGGGMAAAQDPSVSIDDRS